MKSNTIDFTKMAGRIYVGRPEGRSAKIYFKIEKLEEEGRFPIQVIFPDNARTLASSFFLGMFGECVRRAGSRDEFLRRFKFQANDQILNEVNIGITEALSASA